MRTLALAALAVCACQTPSAAEKPASLGPPQSAARKPAADSAGLVAALVQKHGEASRARAERGEKQLAAYWRAEDGDAAAQRAFVEESVRCITGMPSTTAKMQHWQPRMPS